MRRHHLYANLVILGIVLSLIAGCQVAPVDLTSQPTSLLPTPDLTPAKSVPVTTATVVPTASACMESKGKSITGQVETSLLNWPLDFKVYLPPCYSNSNLQPYPVLYMLHGQANNNDQWVRMGLLDAADELIISGEIAPIIIVMPYEITWSVGPEKSKFGDAIISELIPYIEKTYHACDQRECRMIGGLSRGGNWAVNLGFAHPDLFTAVGAHSSPLFFGEINRITESINKGEETIQTPSFYVDAGHKDENLAQVLAFVALLKKNSIPYVYTQFTGYHTEEYWRAHVADYLKWYSSQVEVNP